MTHPGKTVRIYLADGNPGGIKHAELVNWTGQALVCPRVRIGEFAEWDEPKRPGVYFLFGENPDDQTPLAYIGEAENVLVRLKNHVTHKDFWRTVVLFTSKDENLTKAHVKYLESRAIELATAAKRVQLENGNAPPTPSLPRPDRDAMEEFLGPLRILLGALGYNLLESLPQRVLSTPARHATTTATSEPDTGDDHVFRIVIPKKRVDATGAPTDEGFVVYAGSIGSSIAGESATGGVLAARERYMADGAFKVDGETFTVTRDVLFTSPSYAAAALSGYRMNGPRSWKTADGRTLRDVETEALASTPDED